MLNENNLSNNTCTTCDLSNNNNEQITEFNHSMHKKFIEQYNKRNDIKSNSKIKPFQINNQYKNKNEVFNNNNPGFNTLNHPSNISFMNINHPFMNQNNFINENMNINQFPKMNYDLKIQNQQERFIQSLEKDLYNKSLNLKANKHAMNPNNLNDLNINKLKRDHFGINYQTPKIQKKKDKYEMFHISNQNSQCPSEYQNANISFFPFPTEYTEDQHSNTQVYQNFIYNNVNPNLINPHLIQNNITYNNFNNISVIAQENGQQNQRKTYCSNDARYNTNFDFEDTNDEFENLNLDSNYCSNFFNENFSNLNEYNNFNYICSLNKSKGTNNHSSNFIDKKKRKIFSNPDSDKSPLKNNNPQIDDKKNDLINKEIKIAKANETNKIQLISSEENSKLNSPEKFRDNFKEINESLPSSSKEINSQEEKFFGNNFFQKNNKNSKIKGKNFKENSVNKLNICFDEKTDNKTEKINEKENEDEKDLFTFHEIINSSKNKDSFKIKNFFEESVKEHIVDYNLNEAPNKNNKISSLNKNLNNKNAKITSDYYAYKFTSVGESLKLDFGLENYVYKSSEKSRQKIELFVPIDEEFMKNKIENNSKKQEENELKNSQYSIKDHCGSGSHVNLNGNFNQSFEKDFEYIYGPKKSKKLKFKKLIFKI